MYYTSKLVIMPPKPKIYFNNRLRQSILKNNLYTPDDKNYLITILRQNGSSIYPNTIRDLMIGHFIPGGYSSELEIIEFYFKHKLRFHNKLLTEIRKLKLEPKRKDND